MDLIKELIDRLFEDLLPKNILKELKEFILKYEYKTIDDILESIEEYTGGTIVE